MFQQQEPQFGNYGGGLSNFSAVELGCIAAKKTIERAGIQPSEIDEAIIGNILSAGEGQNLARQIAINSGLPETLPAMTINKLCGSGLRAVSMITDGLTDAFNNYHMGITAENIAEQESIL